MFKNVLFTVDENIIATIKMGNFFFYPLKMVICPILQTFLYCSPFSYCSSNFAIAKDDALNLFTSFLYEFCRLVHCFSSLLLPIRATTLERIPSKKKQRTDTKKDAKWIKSDNCTRSNREKSNIAIAIFEK